MNAITLQNATLSYQNKNIFSNIDLEIKSGSWSALLGESGIGKSSLLRMLAGLLPNSNPDQPILSHSFAYMGQQDGLLPWSTVLNNVLLPLKLKKQISKSNRDKAHSLLEKVGLTEAIHLYPHQLSGGMRQRAALARTLIQDANIILMDEPFSALDTVTRYKLQTLAAEMLHDKTVFFITHDPFEALRLSQFIFLMQKAPQTRIQLFAKLTSKAPRDFNHPEVIALQGKLFAALTKNGTQE